MILTVIEVSSAGLRFARGVEQDGAGYFVRFVSCHFRPDGRGNRRLETGEDDPIISRWKGSGARRPADPPLVPKQVPGESKERVRKIFKYRYLPVNPLQVVQGISCPRGRNTPRLSFWYTFSIPVWGEIGVLTARSQYRDAVAPGMRAERGGAETGVLSTD